ncbi:MAG: HAD family hydrolase [Firmicutes bacterium]|nr:HAD family hydrolase [Bacillota bacterium]HOB35556.1 HAD family hydrolase [Bacillota bacterium]HPZ90024.1 HAD family hydrolase [Bacillota bacterium]HQE01431.1 HAD family hydrolase [Bacillota bacterium]
MRYKGVFFDLDGTLLPVDLEEFIARYIEALTAKVAPHVEPQRFRKALLESTAKMMNNDGSRTNEEAFMEAFFARVDIEPRELVPVFEDFYRREYRLLGRGIQARPEARRAVELAAAGGAQVVLATNPLFPRMAVEVRLEWAGLDAFPFRHITTYENSRYCKPNPGYYADILAATGLRGEECLMVGNDTLEDLAAAELGFDTFLLEDFLIERGYPHAPTWRGGWGDLLDVLTGNG